jgi:hypothetical protein
LQFGAANAQLVAWPLPRVGIVSWKALWVSPYLVYTSLTSHFYYIAIQEETASRKLRPDSCG